MADQDRALIYASLAAQLDLLHEQISSVPLVEQLWDVVEHLLALIDAARTDAGSPETDLSAEASGLEHEVNRLLLLQAQQLDFARQAADCVRQALHRLAQQPDAAFTPDDIAKFYVSEAQRAVHRQILARSGGPGDRL